MCHSGTTDKNSYCHDISWIVTFCCNVVRIFIKKSNLKSCFDSVLRTIYIFAFTSYLPWLSLIFANKCFNWDSPSGTRLQFTDVLNLISASKFVFICCCFDLFEFLAWTASAACSYHQGFSKTAVKGLHAHRMRSLTTLRNIIKWLKSIWYGFWVIWQVISSWSSKPPFRIRTNWNTNYICMLAKRSRGNMAEQYTDYR